jgi:hypothetical protein
MQPRIYVYKTTFEEIPDWYWGAHKEVKYGESYLGSPKTHSWKWNFYTPHLQICEIFPYTDEGWTQARRVEDSCILPDLNNPLCLNEHVGGLMSLEICRKAGKNTHKEKDENGKSLHAIKIHAEKDDLGRSVHALKTLGKVHEEKDELGRSVVGVKAAAATHKEKDYLGRSVNAVKSGKAAHEEKDELGRSVHGVKSAERLHEEKDESGRSLHAVKTLGKIHDEKDDLGRSVHAVKTFAAFRAKNPNHQREIALQKWTDPDHPELGQHNPGNLVQKQKALGYPHGKENRVKVG